LRKQIEHNGSGISDVADFKHQSRYEEPQLSKVKMFNRSTSARLPITLKVLPMVAQLKN